MNDHKDHTKPPATPRPRAAVDPDMVTGAGIDMPDGEPDRGPMTPGVVALLSKLVDLGDTGLFDKLLTAVMGEPAPYMPNGCRGYRWSHHSTPLLDAALAKALGNVRNAAPNRSNTHLKSKYADLSAVFLASRQALSDAGVASVQTPWSDADKLMVTTRLACSGQWVESDVQVRIEQQKGLNTKQATGLATTYIKRQMFGSMVMVATGDDDDGGGPPDGQNSQADTPRDTRWQTAVNAFGRLDAKVLPNQMLAFVNRQSVNEVTGQDHDTLETLYQDLSSGKTTAAEAFKS